MLCERDLNKLPAKTTNAKYALFNELKSYTVEVPKTLRLTVYTTKHASRNITDISTLEDGVNCNNQLSNIKINPLHLTPEYGTDRLSQNVGIN